MEIHAPHGPITSLKEALVHLGIVTAGILIALSLEGVLEWTHHRALMQETRQNLQDEIRNNQQDVQLVLKGLDAVNPKIGRAIDLLGDLSTPDRRQEIASLFGPTNPDGLLGGLELAWLNTASYSTAGATGAFGLMDYSEVRKYAEIYDPQALYSRAQDAAETEAMTAFLLGQGIRTTTTQPNPADVADVKRQLRVAQARLVDMSRFASVLNDRYTKALAAP